MLAYTFYESDNRVMRYAETLAKRGDDVEVISLRYEDQPATEDMNGVRVLRIQGRRRDEKGKWIYLWRYLTFLLRATVLLTRHHLKKPYDLVHVHSMPDFLVFAALVPRMQGCPVILDIHDLLPEFYVSKFKGNGRSLLYWILVAEERLSIAFSHHVIIANHIWKERLLGRSVSQPKLSVFINSPDGSVFHLGERERKDSKVIALYPGSLSWHQGLDVAIRAVGLIRDRVPELELHICGSGQEKQALTELVQELGLQQRVLFLQPRPIREVAKLMREADLGIVPKRNDSFGNEAFSTKILEFMASGVAVIVTKTKVDQHYFNDDVVRFVRSDDVQELAQGIILLIEGTELRRSLVDKALSFVSRHDWATDRGRYIALVHGFMRTRQTPRATKPFQSGERRCEEGGSGSEATRQCLAVGDPKQPVQQL